MSKFTDEEAQRDLTSVRTAAIAAVRKAMGPNGGQKMKDVLYYISKIERPSGPKEVMAVVQALGLGDMQSWKGGDREHDREAAQAEKDAMVTKVYLAMSDAGDSERETNADGSFSQVAVGTSDDRPAAAPPVTHNPPPAATSMFTLIRGADTPDVYVLNSRNERFHVTEKLKNEMIAAGAWSEPEVRDQVTVNGMAIRYTVDSIDSLGTINNALIGDNMMLVKGDAPGNPDGSVLVGNGNAVYLVNNQGEKTYVSEAAWNDIVAFDGGVAPAVATITQTDVDAISYAPGADPAAADPILDAAVTSTDAVLGGAVDGGLDPSGYSYSIPDPTGGITGPATVDPGATATPATPPPPEDESLAAVNSGEGIDQYTLIKGINGSPGTANVDNSILPGNNNAVYAVNSKGQKFHVSGPLADAMKLNGTWQSHPIQEMNQSDVDAHPDGSTVSMSNMSQLRSINIGTGQEFRLVKGKGFDNADDNMADGNSRAVFALTSTGEKYHVSAALANKMGGAFGNVEEVNQSEIDSYGANKATIHTIKELNAAVKNKSGAASGFAGDSSIIGGAPAIQGYSTQQ